MEEKHIPTAAEKCSSVDIEDPIVVPRGLLGAAMGAIKAKSGADGSPGTLKLLRWYAFGRPEDAPEPEPKEPELSIRDVASQDAATEPLYLSMIRPTDDDRVSLASAYVQQNFVSGEPWSMTIARAILEERDRCAKVADWFSDTSMHSNWTEDACSAGYFACRSVAEEIRNPKPAPAPSQLIADDEQPF